MKVMKCYEIVVTDIFKFGQVELKSYFSKVICKEWKCLLGNGFRTSNSCFIYFGETERSVIFVKCTSNVCYEKYVCNFSVTNEDKIGKMFWFRVRFCTENHALATFLLFKLREKKVVFELLNVFQCFMPEMGCFFPIFKWRYEKFPILHIYVETFILHRLLW